MSRVVRGVVPEVLIEEMAKQEAERSGRTVAEVRAEWRSPEAQARSRAAIEERERGEAWRANARRQELAQFMVEAFEDGDADAWAEDQADARADMLRVVDAIAGRPEKFDLLLEVLGIEER